MILNAEHWVIMLFCFEASHVLLMFYSDDLCFGFADIREIKKIRILWNSPTHGT